MKSSLKSCSLQARAAFHLTRAWRLLKSGLGLSIDSRNQPRRTGAIGLVVGAKLCAQQLFFRADAADHRNDHQRSQYQAHDRTEGQRPSKRARQKAEISRMSDDAGDAVGDERVD